MMIAIAVEMRMRSTRVFTICNGKVFGDIDVISCQVFPHTDDNGGPASVCPTLCRWVWL